MYACGKCYIRAESCVLGAWDYFFNCGCLQKVEKEEAKAWGAKEWRSSKSLTAATRRNRARPGPAEGTAKV